jgi:transglutaminase-like putative cysteine protease
MLRFGSTAVLILLVAGWAGAQPLFLDTIPTQLREDASVDRAKPLRIAVYSAHPEELAALFEGAIPVERYGDHVVLELTGYPVIEGRFRKRYERDSFVVDFKDEPLASLVERARSELPAPLTIQSLERFADAAIVGKTRTRGFDIASVVASRSEGDCTEHAVLLAALARGLDRPARIVIGVVIVDTGEEFHAYGHAWAEIYTGDTWLRADATRIAGQAQHAGARLHYLPLAIIEDEGPGYELSYMGEVNTKWIDRIEILPNASSQAG